MMCWNSKSKGNK